MFYKITNTSSRVYVDIYSVVGDESSLVSSASIVKNNFSLSLSDKVYIYDSGNVSVMAEYGMVYDENWATYVTDLDASLDTIKTEVLTKFDTAGILESSSTGGSGGTATIPTGSNLLVTSGVITTPAYSYDPATATIDIDGTGVVRLFTQNDFVGAVEQFTVATKTLTLVLGVTNYIYVDYNSGTPEYFITEDVSIINGSDRTPMFMLSQVGTLDTGFSIVDFSETAIGDTIKVTQRLIDTRRFQRAGISGLEIAMLSSRVFG